MSYLVPGQVTKLELLETPLADAIGNIIKAYGPTPAARELVMYVFDQKAKFQQPEAKS
jgi:hypothetical protein